MEEFDHHDIEGDTVRLKIIYHFFFINFEFILRNKTSQD